MIRRTHVNPTVDVLRQLSLFQGCSRRRLETIGRHADEVRLRAGFTLVREGDAPVDFFLLVAGEAEVTVAGARVGSTGAGSMLGVDSLLAGSARAASVITSTPTRVFSFRGAAIGELLVDPRIAERLRSRASALPECSFGAGTSPASALTRPLLETAVTA